MITEVDANLLEYPLDGFLHQANCFNTMGSGIAAQIKSKYPELYKADLLYSRKGDISKLGKFSWVKCHDDKIGYNMYSQYNYGMNKRHTNYDAVYTGLLAIEDHAINNNVKRLGLPRNIGCKLGGGDFRIVKVMIDVIFEKSSIDLYICNYEG